ncbi:MAG: hypothetical protein ACRCZE_00185 [Candidatus Altimarinota bacterium]
MSLAAESLPSSTEKSPHHSLESGKKAPDIKQISQQIEEEFGKTPEDRALIKKISQEIYQEKLAKGEIKNASYQEFMGGINLDKSFLSENELNTGKLLPERSPDAPTGTEFMRQMQKLGNMNFKGTQARMEKLVEEEIAKGNVPSFCRPENMKTIDLKGADGTTVKFQTTVDYLAIGSDNDYVRVPITPILAQHLSEKYGWGLPTRTMAHSIHDQADIQLTGIGLVNSDEDQEQMQGIGFIQKHNQKIEKQLGPDGLARLRSGKALVAGHKKDVIISRYVIDNPNGAMDYSGLYVNGRTPVQDTPAHEWTYRDYSHGFRPIGGNVIIAHPDGRTETMKYYDAIKDKKIAKILNGAEGAFNAYQAYHSTPVSQKGNRREV